jgi:Ser/Thr protein kinase RdoA (MazF antagonist)
VNGEKRALATLPAELVRRLRAERGVDVVAAEELPDGKNNRLLRLETADGRPLLAKVYQQDGRDRLEREFGLLAFLGERGFPWTPRAVLRDRGPAWAVYSFEDGATKPAEAYSAEDGRELGRFAAALHRITPEERGIDFDFCINPTPSLGAAVARIGARLRVLLDDDDAMEHPLLRELAGRLDLETTIRDLTARAAEGLSDASLAERLPRDRWRLTNCDPGPHNVLVRADGGVCVVDWEYGGWDDPLALPIGFVTHVTSLAVPSAAIDAFERTYLELTDHSPADLARMSVLRRLFEVEWLTIHLNGMAGEKIASRRFAAADFDLDAYLAEQIALFDRRLARVRQLLSR